MRKLLSREIKKKIIKLYKSGLTAPKVAAKLNIGETSVYRTLNENNIKPNELCKSRKRKGRYRFTLKKERNIYKRYLNGESSIKLAKELKTNDRTIANIIQRFSGQMRKVGGPSRKFSNKEIDDIARDWQSGKSYTHITKKYKTAWKAIIKLLTNLGFKVSARRLIGRDHPNWRGGIVPSYGPNWYSQRKKVRQRDGHKCLICLRTRQELGYELSVAHIIPFRKFGIKKHILANNLTNLISLCRNCHAEFDGNNGTRSKKKKSVYVLLQENISVELPISLANKWIDYHRLLRDKKYKCNRCGCKNII